MENCTKFGQLTVSKIIKIVATSCQMLRLKCIKFDFGWCSAPHPLGELTALPQTPYLACIRDPACIQDSAFIRDPASISTICLDTRPVSGTWRLSGDLRYATRKITAFTSIVQSHNNILYITLKTCIYKYIFCYY